MRKNGLPALCHLRAARIAGLPIALIFARFLRPAATDKCSPNFIIIGMSQADLVGRKHCRRGLTLPARSCPRIFALRGWMLLCASAFALGACGQRATRSVVAPAFADYYAAHGGMRTLGTALSAALLVDGTETQYFLGGCLQHFPRLEVGSTVIPCVLPSELRLEQPPLPADAMPESVLGFAETGHTVQFAFREFFTAAATVSGCVKSTEINCSTFRSLGLRSRAITFAPAASNNSVV